MRQWYDRHGLYVYCNPEDGNWIVRKAWGFGWTMNLANPRTWLFLAGVLVVLLAVCTAGTADIPVAEEAAQTAEFFGAQVVRVYDVGVSGIHRLLDKVDVLQRANCVVAVAGMEGALASVIGGLVRNPVIAVPTSVGYGASFHGLSALLTMINSCANCISVVNIDNGFSAGYIATQINRLAER